ncbi:NADH-quinone oxidoreductase subunit NuoF [Dehalobacterium formicoaceticum]|uniref:NADH-quinone oxidoreductase subunit NuoF n=1 Tax=Dehalobacterium formicoaceticum TaxID=51515 RepID=A0ABT1Y0L1_9FIRM|nr:NADH-quinone oxidoreductase subunit NuoF [Dehalobacterium formicoaceticum]MCR6544400.1 NADH-quinone oxidoreductase subunit NuoF [Dehalobacterium formicoaceticum]
MKKIQNLHELNDFRTQLSQENSDQDHHINICCGTGCRAGGALEVVEELKKIKEKYQLKIKLSTKMTGCHGFCEQGPLMTIDPGHILYCKVQPGDVQEIFDKTLLRGEVIERLLYTDPATGKKIAREGEIPFYQKQTRVLLAQNGTISPISIEDYLAQGGFAALGKALTQFTPESIIAEVKSAGLRGRGGGGFPTGLKWEACRKAQRGQKYLICNADEGDPGCFQDRSILEGNPYSVLEGMIIGAFAMGADTGYIYVRDEYPLAIEHLQQALKQAQSYGFLGENILGSGFSFEIKISRGGGAFVCGEETALISSIEGLSGEPNPRSRPPYPAQKGLWGQPTVINNVKTWAFIPHIIEKGALWFSRQGTEKSKGTMVFSLTGKVHNTGLVEVPMGITLRELIYEIGGGISNNRRFKAVQTGGPAGGCIPEEFLDLNIDYERLAEAGTIMGSGGMIVMDESTCMVDVARYFLSFTMDESCGKCTPCREGGKQMLHVLTRITQGEGTLEDLDFLKHMAQVMKDASLCGLGKMAGNPVLTTMKYFPEEYLSHVRDKKCPAGVCKALITYHIDKDLCTGCGRCLKNCPVSAIIGMKKESHTIDQTKCTKCGTCLEVCKFDAVKLE